MFRKIILQQVPEAVFQLKLYLVMGTFRPDTGEGAIIGKGATPLSDKRKYCNYRAIVY